MKKIIFGIFAHPDDEAFGPSGALLRETKAGNELYLITLTSGEAGTNQDNDTSLGETRLREWRAAGALMGATDMYALDYRDSQLTNVDMITASERIRAIVQPLIASASPDTVIEFITNDLNGISGHIDHIVAARAACHAFYTLKQADKRLSRVRLSCVSRSALPTSNTHWLYMEAGRTLEEIDETVDARDLQPEIIAIMRAHHSQRADGETHIAQQGDRLGIYHFIVKQ